MILQLPSRTNFFMNIFHVLTNQSMIHLGKIILDLLVLSYSKVIQLNHHYIWHIESLHVHLKGMLVYRL